ncbi:hypothetical protein CHLRE_12g503400v5 [Chlamydomonas reinhardtii]|uniref:Pre-mRNA-splicing factor 38 n=1 Tax=Chlamydomonas reinhardtii TaxID=3055 RepID=A0A2K3D323_CHLRE|nr:uncharacterized protein CHLRE_12g503400v5 [Chlamydomonas reinhardtii]PNW74942.1 hypothetical protein CHLRE_12g503400v5 [Chlamydomonas reinhardtii]
MANRTDPDVKTVHGTNPQNLVEYIVRQKIYQTTYWKEKCFALTAESLLEVAVQLKSVGGTFGGQRKPSDFLCLLLKMLQIQPDKEIIIEYIKNEDFKYVRLLGAFYMRLVGKPLEVYQYLEPLYNDYRKVRLQTLEGAYALTHVDEVVDDMLRKDFLFDIALPRVPSRYTLEKLGQLDPRISVLDEEFDEAILELEAGEAAKQAAEMQAKLGNAGGAAPAAGPGAGLPLPPPPPLDSGRAPERERDVDRERRRSPAREAERERAERERERERERDRDRGGREADFRDRDRDRDYRDRDRDRDYRDSRRSRSRSRDRRDRGRDRDYRRSRSRSRGRDSRSRSRDRRDRDRDRGYRRSSRSPSRSRSRDRDYRRGGGRDRRDSRSRSRSRDRDRGRDRSRSRERDRGGRGDRDRDRDGGAAPKKEKEKAKDKPKEKAAAGGGKKAVDTEDPEIVEANKLRAKLGLKPLK